MAQQGDYKEGDRVYRYRNTGSDLEPQPLTVVRVNRVWITVRTDVGSVFRIRREGIIDYRTKDH